MQNERQRIRDFYQLKADLLKAELDPVSKRLVLFFDKRNDPAYSVERLNALRGFVICSVRGRHKPQAVDNAVEQTSLPC